MSTLLESRSNDALRGRQLIAVLCEEPREIRTVVVPGAPKSKARPRLGRHGTYSPDAPNQTALALQLRPLLPRFEKNVALGALFFRPNYQRIDVDNLLKLVLDSGTQAGLWHDDCQVTGLVGVVELDAETPRTIVAIGEHESTLDRSKGALQRTCRQCGRGFDVYWQGAKTRYCSPRCQGIAGREAKVRPGQGRGAKGQAPAHCIDCGVELSKRSYLRCRPCWRVRPRPDALTETSNA